jgi:hypothetical protein
MPTTAKTSLDGSLVVKDGANTPLTFTVPFEKGDFQVSDLSPHGREVTVIEGRGNLLSLRRGKRKYPTGSFSCFIPKLTAGAASASLLDVLSRKSGSTWADATSTTAAIGNVFTYDFAWTIEGTDLGDAADHAAVFEDICVDSYSIAEAEDGDTVSVTFTVYGNVTGDLSMVA